MEVFRAQRWVFSDKVNYAMQQCTFHEKHKHRTKLSFMDIFIFFWLAHP